MKNIYIITGGTMVHVAPHFSLCAPAYGNVGDTLSEYIAGAIADAGVIDDYTIHVLPTKMAEGSVQDYSCYYHFQEIYEEAGLSKLETNDDLSQLVDYLIEQDDTRCIIMAAAVCDFKPSSLVFTDELGTSYKSITKFGKSQERLSSKDKLSLHMEADEKILSKIRKTRKDIFLASFKTTAGVGHDETYRRGLESLKKNSSNLVFANDIKDKINMVITPEEFPYKEQTREQALETFAEMIVSRIQLTFNRTAVIEGDKASIKELYDGDNIPENFVEIMVDLILKKAYKPFRGKTSGHFGCKVEGKEFDRIASVRKVDHNNVFDEGMAKIFRKDGNIISMGGKPSVGEHTQEMIYNTLGDKVHSIVHFHSPLRDVMDHTSIKIPVRSQRDFECGSNECGINTSSGMEEIIPGVYVVHLENHGPNIAFHKDVDSGDLMAFLDRYWDLSDKEGGLIKEANSEINSHNIV